MKLMLIAISMACLALAGCKTSADNADGSSPVLTGQICANGYCFGPEVKAPVATPTPTPTPALASLTMAKTGVIPDVPRGAKPLEK